jgi:hypothetical protein
MKTKKQLGPQGAEIPVCLGPVKLFSSLRAFYRRKKVVDPGKILASSFPLKEIVHQMTFLFVYFDQAESP